MENNVKLQVKVIPQSKQNKIESPVFDNSGNITMKVRVTAPAVDGKANQALIESLAKFFQIKKSQIEIISGQRARQKVIQLFEVSKKDIIKNLQLNLL